MDNKKELLERKEQLLKLIESSKKYVKHWEKEIKDNHYSETDTGYYPSSNYRLLNENKEEVKYYGYELEEIETELRELGEQ